MVRGSKLRSMSADSRRMTREWDTRKDLPQSTNWLWPSGSDEQVQALPSACQLGPLNTEISQMKLMRHRVEVSLTARLA